MKRLVTIQALLLVAISFVACGVTWSNVAYNDDLYEMHDKSVIAERKQLREINDLAREQAAQAEYEALMAQVNGSSNSFSSVLADDYESAYARRLMGFSSPTYRMPSSYYTYRYSDAFFYASAYDPAFYNVMVSGDMVWVEPKYVTSMFGSWGATPIPSYSWYYGWGNPYMDWWWGPSYRYGWRNYWYSGYYNPFYWGYPYYWGNPYHYCYNPYHHHHYYPPHHHHGGVGNTGHSRYDFNERVYRNQRAATPAARGGTSYRSSGSSYRSSTPSSGSSYRSSGSSSSRSSGSSSYRSSGGSSSYRSSGSSSSSSGSSISRGTRGSYQAPSSSYRSSGSSSSSSSSSGSYRSSGSTHGR